MKNFTHITLKTAVRILVLLLWLAIAAATTLLNQNAL